MGCSGFVKILSQCGLGDLPPGGGVWVGGTLRASLSGTFLQGRKDVVNQCLEFGLGVEVGILFLFRGGGGGEDNVCFV